MGEMQATRTSGSVARLVVLKLAAPLHWIRDYFPLSLQGAIVLMLALVSLQLFAYGRMDLVVFALTVCAIAIVLFCLFAVLTGGLIVKHSLKASTGTGTRQSMDIKAEAGYPNETGFTVNAIRFLPLVSLDWHIVYPDSIHCRHRLTADGSALEEEIVPLRRCRSNKVTRLYTVRDVLGLCRFSWRQTQDMQLTVLPQSGKIKNLPLLRSLTAEDGLPNPGGEPEGDRMEIRPYAPGDSVRNIMWNVYARNRHLNVRLAEKSVFHSDKTLAYLLSGPNDEAAAAVARVAVESGALGDNWVFSADGSTDTTSNKNTALEMIAASRALGTPHPYGLDDFLRSLDQHQHAHCIVFAAAEPGKWPQALRHTVASNKGRFSVVLATDGFTQEQENTLLQRLMYYPARDTIATEGTPDRRPPSLKSADVSEIRLLLTELKQFTESAFIVDRRTGSSFDQRMKRV